MLGLVRHARACPRLSKIKKQHYLWEGLTYFAYLFLYVVTQSWKLQCYHVISVGYGPACPKFSEATNHQYLWKWSCDFVDFLLVVICILLDIHWNYKNMLFWAGIVRHSHSVNQIVKCFKLKKLKKDMMYQVDFLLPLKLEEILCYDPKILLVNQFAGYFSFGLFDLLNVIPGVHCYIELCYILFYGK